MQNEAAPPKTNIVTKNHPTSGSSTLISVQESANLPLLFVCSSSANRMDSISVRMEMQSLQNRVHLRTGAERNTNHPTDNNKSPTCNPPNNAPMLARTSNDTIMETTKPIKKSKFEIECEQVSAKTGISFYSPWNDDDMKLDAYEDDECLHIHKRGTHACFGVGGNGICAGKQNKNTRAVLEALGLSKMIGERVLIENEEEDDEWGDYCHECGFNHA